MTVIAPSASATDKTAARERRVHAVPDPRRIDRQTLIDRPDHGVERRRIETRQPPVLEPESAVAGERADQRNRAHPAPSTRDIERQPAGRAAPSPGSNSAALTPASWTLARARQGPRRAVRSVSSPRDAAAGDAAVDRLQRQLRFAEAHHAADIARGELGRERDPRGFDRDLTGQACVNAGSNGSAGHSRAHRRARGAGAADAPAASTGRQIDAHRARARRRS